MRPHDKNGYNAGVRFNCFMDVSLRNNKKLPSTTAMENKSMVIADRPYNLQLKTWGGIWCVGYGVWSHN